MNRKYMETPTFTLMRLGQGGLGLDMQNQNILADYEYYRTFSATIQGFVESIMKLMLFNPFL